VTRENRRPRGRHIFKPSGKRGHRGADPRKREEKKEKGTDGGKKGISQFLKGEESSNPLQKKRASQKGGRRKGEEQGKKNQRELKRRFHSTGRRDERSPGREVLGRRAISWKGKRREGSNIAGKYL